MELSKKDLDVMLHHAYMLGAAKMKLDCLEAMGNDSYRTADISVDYIRNIQIKSPFDKQAF